MLPFTEAPALPHPVHPQVPVSGGPWSFQDQLLKTYALFSEQLPGESVKGASGNRLAGQTARD